MSTDLKSDLKKDVVGRNRPRTRPRGEAVCVGGYYVTPPTSHLRDPETPVVGDGPTAHVNPFYQRASTRLLEQGKRGGKHRASVGDSCSNTESALQAWFAREQAELANAVEAQPW